MTRQEFARGLLDHLRARGIDVVAPVGGEPRLLYRPKGALTDAEKLAIRFVKPELLELLAEQRRVLDDLWRQG